MVLVFEGVATLVLMLVVLALLFEMGVMLEEGAVRLPALVLFLLADVMVVGRPACLMALRLVLEVEVEVGLADFAILC